MPSNQSRGPVAVDLVVKLSSCVDECRVLCSRFAMLWLSGCYGYDCFCGMPRNKNFTQFHPSTFGVKFPGHTHTADPRIGGTNRATYKGHPERRICV